jgi:hypothetical protein
MFFNAIKVNLARLLDWPFFVVLGVRGTKSKVGREDGLRPIHQEEWGIARD